MDKKVSFLWSFGVGLLILVLSFVMFLLGFGNSDTGASVIDYVMIFLTGTLIGLVLVYFLRRSEKKSIYNATLIAFVISLPFALFGVVFGSVVGGIGILLLGVSPSVFITGVVYYIGRAFSGK
ncbi:MAG: hypothetical protein U0V02_12085 [Anaerolineales bacterium]